MKAKRLISAVLSACIAVTGVTALSAGLTVSAADKTAVDYSYKVTPLLEPFNVYFFVETDNPDPNSFRFEDKDTVYYIDGVSRYDGHKYNQLCVYDEAFADVKYDNLETKRVDGGYIFWAPYGDIDGGELVLKYQARVKDGYYYTTKWVESDVKITLPRLIDDVDYLVDTYATKSEFFDNMNAVQSGFSSICLYSGSSIRGNLEKIGQYWSLSNSPHKDQSFYIQSPYTRKNGKRLFTSSIYPFRRDSLGFPSVMGEVALRLDKSASYKWNSNSHYLIDVTYNGVTKSYGGQGEGKGQQISEDKITKYYSFEKNAAKISLEETRELLDYYSKVEMDDDVPSEDALTFEKVCNTVGDGAWVRLTGIVGIFGATEECYTYLYKKNDGNSFSADKAGSNGGQIYWGGDMGYVSDAWVDGRYIDSYEAYVPGAKFEDYPTSDILMKNVKIPLVTYKTNYKFNYETNQYDREYNILEVTEKTENVAFWYSKADDSWEIDPTAFYYKEGNVSHINYYANYDQLVAFVKQGLLDAKYIEGLTLTRAEVEAMHVDRNTDILPSKGYIYDGTAEPGTIFDNIVYERGDVNGDGHMDISDATLIQKVLASLVKITEKQEKAADFDGNGVINISDVTALQKALAGYAESK